MTDGERWNTPEHQERVASDAYLNQMQHVFAPYIGKFISFELLQQDGAVVHDMGGYDGRLIDELRRNGALSDSCSPIVTDVTEPEHAVNENVPFYKAACWDAVEVFDKRSVDATISCNVFHLLDDEQLATTADVVKLTSKPGSTLVSIVPHPVTHRVQWSDFAGIDAPAFVARRGTFIDNYTNARQAPHAFLPGVVSYPRTVEGYLSPFLRAGFRLRMVDPLYVPREYARPGRDERFYQALASLPTYLAMGWRVES